MNKYIPLSCTRMTCKELLWLRLKSLSELTTDDSKAIVDMYNSIKNDIKYEIMKIDTKTNPNESDKLKKLQLKDLLRSLDKNLKELEEQQANMITSSMNNVRQAVVQSNFENSRQVWPIYLKMLLLIL